jgi:hypothetical protein
MLRDELSYNGEKPVLKSFSNRRSSETTERTTYRDMPGDIQRHGKSPRPIDGWEEVTELFGRRAPNLTQASTR